MLLYECAVSVFNVCIYVEEIEHNNVTMPYAMKILNYATCINLINLIKSSDLISSMHTLKCMQ